AALGQRNRQGSPLQVGDTGTFSFDVRSPDLGLVSVEIEFSVVGIRDSFNVAGRDSLFFIADRDLLQRQIHAGQRASLGLRADTIWLKLSNRQPSTEVTSRLQELPGVSTVTYAWDVYNTFLREPLPNAVSGVLYAGFWVSLLLSLMDFSFYLSVTLRQRAASFATLRALGWSEGRLPQLLLVEQFLFVAPALVMGVLAGWLLAGLIMPFFALAGSEALQVPVMDVLLLLMIIGASFTAMLRLAAMSLRRMELTQVMRFGD
ncbi:MAG: ABC transporter permease, partial [Anaerolineae bacterium]|nr:ABC transporter permease [Anaerolineae bacterium]